MRIFLIAFFLQLVSTLSWAQPGNFVGDLSLTVNPHPEPFVYDTAWIRTHEVKMVTYSSYEANRKGKLISRTETTKEMTFDKNGYMTTVDQYSNLLGDQSYGFKYDYRGCPSLLNPDEDPDSLLTHYTCDEKGRLLIIQGPEDTSVFRYDAKDRLVEERYNGYELPYGSEFEYNTFEYDATGNLKSYLKQDVRASESTIDEGIDTLFCNVTLFKYHYEDANLKRISEYFAETEFDRAVPNRFDTTNVSTVYTEFQHDGKKLTSSTFYYPELDKGYADFSYDDKGFVTEIQYYSMSPRGVKIWDSLVFMDYEFFGEPEESEESEEKPEQDEE